MPIKYKVIKSFVPLEIGDVLELTGDGAAYTNGNAYINKREVERNPDTFELVKPKAAKPLTADNFLGGDK
jgi:hypothetical protein